MGEEESDAIFGPVEVRGTALEVVAVRACWSTGWKLQSFFNLIQWTHRP